ncbi:MAG: DUF3899 domain-containing protein [Clostridia bacterium]|nr:DUF3899 domain-containing protein [Clostridia bacterium]
MKDKKNLWSAVILAAVAMILFITCATLWGLFEQTEPLQTVRILADCCTIPAVLYVGITLIGWVGSKGTFDIFGYSIGGLFRLLKRESYDNKQETFYDYRTKKDENRKPFNWPMLVVGLAFLLLAVVFSVIYAVME